MRDEELVLRFLALWSDLPGYKPPLTQFLNEYMRKNRQTVPAADAVQAFRSTMGTVSRVLGATAFRGLRDGASSPNLNRALFDAVSLSFAFADPEEVGRKGSDVRQAHRQLLEDATFLPLIGRATADRSRMHGRVRAYATKLGALGVPLYLPHLQDE